MTRLKRKHFLLSEDVKTTIEPQQNKCHSFGGRVSCICIVVVVLVCLVFEFTPHRNHSTISLINTPDSLIAAYNIIDTYVRDSGGHVALVGHDPNSIGDQEGLHGNSPWSLELYNARYEKGPWSPWSEEIIDNNHSYYAEIHNRNDLFLPNTPFYLTTEEYEAFPIEVRDAIDVWNSLNYRAYINEYYVETYNQSKGVSPLVDGKILHKIGILSDVEIETLKTWGYGFPFDNTWSDGLMVYGSTCGNPPAPKSGKNTDKDKSCVSQQGSGNYNCYFCYNDNNCYIHGAKHSRCPHSNICIKYSPQSTPGCDCWYFQQWLWGWGESYTKGGTCLPGRYAGDE